MPGNDVSKNERSTFGVQWPADPSSDGTGQDRADGETLNEETFHYFLAIERQRSERSGRPFVLLLVELKDAAGQSLNIDQYVALKVFMGLRACLRETDIRGWYRTHLAAGALLTELGDGAAADLRGPVGQRIKERIARDLPQDLARHLQVAVYHLRPTLTT